MTNQGGFMILLLAGAACLIAAAYIFTKPDDRADLTAAIHDAGRAGTRCESLQKAVTQLQDKLDTLYGEMRDAALTQAASSEGVTKSLKLLYEDAEKMSMRQLRLEAKVGGEKTLSIKVTAPIPVEVVRPPPLPAKKKAQK